MHDENSVAKSALVEGIIKNLPLHKQYINKVPNKSTRMKVLHIDGNRYTVVIENRTIVSVLDRNRELEPMKMSQIIMRLESFFGNQLGQLGTGVYVFDLCYNRSLCIFDIFYNNSVSVMAMTWAERIKVLRSLDLMSQRIKIPNDQEDRNLYDQDHRFGSKIVRSMDAFALYTEEYKISSLTNAMYLIVGEAISIRTVKAYLPKSFEKLSDVPLKVQIALVENEEGYDALSDDDKLIVLNALRDQRINAAQPHERPYVQYNNYDHVVLVAARNEGNELQIIGTAKKNIIKDGDRTIVPQPSQLKWCDENAINTFQAGSVHFFKRLLVVDCKKVNKFTGRLVVVSPVSVKAYYDVSQIDDIQNVDMVPISANVRAANLYAISSESLLSEIITRINIEAMQNPENPLHELALRNSKQLISYVLELGDMYRRRDATFMKQRQSAQEMELAQMKLFKSSVDEYSSDDGEEDSNGAGVEAMDTDDTHGGDRKRKKLMNKN